jgi:putative peptidoglycan lipid II flippase
MIRRFFSILNKEFGGINEAAFLLGAFALFSQILGLFRDRSLAHFVGPSSTLDIYYAGFRIPDLIFNSVASLVSITVLIPFFIEKLNKDDSGEGGGHARHFFNEVFTSFAFFITLVALLVFIFMPKLAHLVAPGFGVSEMKDLVTMSRIMLLSPIFLGMSNLFGTVTQIYKRYLVYALAPVFYNLGIIFGIIFLYPKFGKFGLAYGVALGALLHMSLQIPVLLRNHFVPIITKRINFAHIKKVFLLSLPRTLALSLNSFAIAAIVSIASTIREGSISLFNFSYNLQAVPISIIGVSYSVAAFPMLAHAFSSGQIENFKKQIISASRQIIFWSLPIIFLFIVLRAQIVRVILGSGQFSWNDTKLTAASLALFSLSVLAQSLIVLFVRGYYAAGKTRRPLVVNLVFTALEIAFAFLFLHLFRQWEGFRFFIESLFRVEDVPGTELLMLPLGYSLGTILNFFGLWFLFKKDFLREHTNSLARTFFQVFAGAFFMGFVAYKFLDIFDNIFNINTFWGILGQGFFAGIVGIFAGIFVLWLLKNPEFEEVKKAFKHKFWREKVIVPDQKEL